MAEPPLAATWHRYVTQYDTETPTFVFHVNREAELHPSVLKWLENTIRSQAPISPRSAPTGHPICGRPLWTGHGLVWTDIDTHSRTHSLAVGLHSDAAKVCAEGGAGAEASAVRSAGADEIIARGHHNKCLVVMAPWA